jgi:hypothetical protein
MHPIAPLVGSRSSSGEATPQVDTDKMARSCPGWRPKFA